MYELLDIKWGASTYGTPGGVVTWSDDLSGLTPSGGSGTGDLITSLRAAFDAWEDVAAIEFLEVSSGADITIASAPFSSDGDPSNNGAAGTASWSSGFGLSEPTNVEIEFNSDLIWSPNSNFYVVALHEIGHVIGLDHVEDRSEIMNATVFASELGDGDKMGAQAIYGTDPGDEVVDAPDEGSLAEGGGSGGGGGAAIGLLLGLLALVFGVFTGGAGAAAVVIAGRLPDDEEDEDDHDHDHDHEGVHVGHDANYHVAYLPTVPVDDHDRPFGADNDDNEEDFWLL